MIKLHFLFLALSLLLPGFASATDQVDPLVVTIEELTDEEFDAFSELNDHDDRYWLCIARDIGWEEHWRGHRGVDWDYWSAHYRALRECRHYHRRCFVECTPIR